MKICPKCGKDNGNNSKYCERCGSLLSGEKKAKKDPNNKMVIVAGILAVALIIGGVVLLISQNRSNEETASIVNTIIETDPEPESESESEPEPEPESEREPEPEPDPDLTMQSASNQYTPFYGVWCGASKDEAGAENVASILRNNGLPADIYITTDWNNLNAEKWYVISAGTYDSKEEAELVLPHVKDYFENAYIKYSGEWTH